MFETANIRLTDIIDVRTLQEIQDSFSKATGMAAIVTDEYGTEITRGSNFTDFYMNITRNSEIGCQHCDECRKKCTENSMRSKDVSVNRSPSGLIEFSVPIILNGQYLGAFLGGQVFDTLPDENKLRKYADEIGIDPTKCISTAQKVNIVPISQVKDSAKFLSTTVNIIAKTSNSNSVADTASAGTADFSMDTNRERKFRKAGSLLEQNSTNIQKLRKEFDSLENIAKASVSMVASTMATVKVIQDVASNTRILGFNAYVEASHAKENGKGFGVITQEIRNLADSSMESAAKIEDAITGISDSTKQIEMQIKNTHKILNDCTENIDQFANFLKDVYSI